MRPRLATLASSLGASLAALAAPVAAAQPVRPYRPAVDVLDYEFALSLPDSGAALDAQATVRFVRAAPTDTLVLDLIGLRVRDVRVDGRAARFARDSATVRVALPRARAAGGAGDTLTAVVRYDGEPRDGLIVSRDSAGRWLAFGDNWPDRARHWLATVDHPSDKATVTWVVTAPSSRTVVANGELVDERDAPAAVRKDGGGAPRRVTRWRTTRPIPTYLMVIAAAPLVRVDLGETACGLGEVRRCVPQSVYVAPEVRDFAPGPFAQAEEIVRFFATLVAPFPYEKLAHLQSSTRFGGMENAGAIFYSDRAFRRRTLGVGLVAHETAHQWFGDAATEREWAHLWLSEGFATYWAALYARRAEGDSAFRDQMRDIRARVVESPVSAARPVIDTAETTYMRLLNTNSYQKGGWVLHMLRSTLGDSAFFGGVRAYYLAHRHSTAVTDDLRRALETASGRELGWFFDQWLRRPGFPELTTRWRHDAATGRVLLTVTQGARFGAYRFPLAVAVEDADGRWHRTRVEVPAEREVTLPLAVPLSAPPRAVRLDPDVELLATFDAAAR